MTDTRHHPFGLTTDADGIVPYCGCGWLAFVSIGTGGHTDAAYAEAQWQWRKHHDLATGVWNPPDHPPAKSTNAFPLSTELEADTAGMPPEGGWLPYLAQPPTDSQLHRLRSLGWTGDDPPTRGAAYAAIIWYEQALRTVDEISTDDHP
jgi:hypothetical protein